LTRPAKSDGTPYGFLEATAASTPAYFSVVA
jgi:hypothetical protein